VVCAGRFDRPGRSGLPEAAGRSAGADGSEGNGARARPNPYTRATEGWRNETQSSPSVSEENRNGRVGQKAEVTRTRKGCKRFFEDVCVWQKERRGVAV
jgi:hypothetical protein